jgi:lipid-binding SYLF domain-containing protein
MMETRSRFVLVAVIAVFSCAVATRPARAASAEAIDAKVEAALQRLYTDVSGSRRIVEIAKGILIFPNVVKAGFGVGGEYGTGSLRVDGRSAGYYSTTAASIGFQIGAQTKSIVICFMTDESLAEFRKRSGWEIGVDGSVAIIDVGVGGSLDTTAAGKPVVGFVFGQNGLMANISLEGAKITKIEPD